MKIAYLKISSFLAKKYWADLPLEKSRFLDEIQIFFLKLAIKSVCPKMSPETFFGLPRDQGERNSPEKIKSG